MLCTCLRISYSHGCRRRRADCRDTLNYRESVDSVLVFIINELSRPLSGHDMRHLLNRDTTDGVSLLGKAAQRYLLKVLRALVKCGASLGKNSIAVSVYPDTDHPNRAELDVRLRYIRITRSIRTLSGRNMCTSIHGPCKPLLSHVQRPTFLIAPVWVLASLQKHLPTSYRSQDRLRDNILWFHVPSTNARIAILIYFATLLKVICYSDATCCADKSSSHV